MPQCSQCERPAIVEYETHPLCVEHYRMMMQIEHSRLSWVTASLNEIRAQINASSLVRLPKMEIPPNLFVGGNIAFNNINVNQSTIGAINTGTLANLDVSISIMQSRGENELAKAVKELTEEIIKNSEINDSIKDEINQQLEFLVSQAMAESQHRSMGTVKSVLAGIRNSVSTIASLLTIWNNVEPLIKATLGIS